MVEVLGHEEIRFRFLHACYQKHYGGFAGVPVTTSEVITESEMEKTDNNTLVGDIVYLDEKNLIKADYALGNLMPYSVKITSYGIDTVEQIMNETINKIFNEVSDEIDAPILKKIENEDSPPKRYKTIMNYAKDYHEIGYFIARLFAKLISGVDT